MLVEEYIGCSTGGLRGLNNQVIWVMRKLKPGCLQRIEHPKLSLEPEVLPVMQAAAAKALLKFADSLPAGNQITINSIFRPITAQCLIWDWYCHGKCGIPLAAKPGRSSHGSGLAIDIDEPYKWLPELAKYKFFHTYSNDAPHFDYGGTDGDDLRALGIRAFQRLWNLANPNSKIDEDGTMGDRTLDKVLGSPCEGFPGLDFPRILRLTDPIQAGKDAGALQLALRRAGVEIESADCEFGAATEIAVKQFQKSKSLVVDGIAGYGTQKALGLLPEDFSEI
jgi:N-acetylmuramoyl-L-alanine amidase